MFDAWTTLGTIGGAGALSYLAAGQKNKESGKPLLRLSIDKKGSMIGDVRLLGGTVTALAAYYVSNQQAKRALMTISLASFASLVCTELVRVRLVKDNLVEKAPLAPFGNPSFGALPGPAGVYGNYQAQGAWASR